MTPVHRGGRIRMRATVAGCVLAVVCAACTPSPSSKSSTSSGVATAPSTTIATPTTPPAACSTRPDDCSLREIAIARGLIVGTAVRATPLRTDASYRARVAREFNSVTPETQAKWATVEGSDGSPNFAAMDALVAFAAANGVRVRGHTLVWDPHDGDAVPRRVARLSDPARLEKAMTEHIRVEVQRYRGRVDRWDVVNEPLVKLGAGLDHNHFFAVLGPRYINEAFRAAHDADPDAQLWLNENVFEHLPSKADALVDLVSQLLHEGVPLAGVGLQAHFVSGRAPAAGVIEALVARVRHLGVQVAITELDIAMSKAGAVAQASAYAQVVNEAIGGGADEITVWGVDDANTWLDAFLRRVRTDPLLFDRDGHPKPAYNAVKTALNTAQKPHQ